jgi:predicted peptidase
MRTAFRSLTVLTLFVVMMPKAQSEEIKQPSTKPDDLLFKNFEPREYADKAGKILAYRLLKPIDYDPGTKYPLVVFLHGAGERGDDNVSQLKHAAKDFANEERRRMYPAYVLMPQCPKDRRWCEVDWKLNAHNFPENPSEPLRLVKELIDVMLESAGVDETRVYITGLSMGGFGTWDAIARYDNLFAAAAPICGGADLKTAEKLSRFPIWTFHGDKDQSVNVSRTREMVAALKALGSTIQYTEYPGVPHDSWTETYKNPELYAWLFAQQKP